MIDIVSIVTGEPIATVVLDMFMSAPAMAIAPSSRASVVDAPLASDFAALMRNQPAVPAAIPLKLQTPDFDNVPLLGAPNVRPLTELTPPAKVPPGVAVSVVTVVVSVNPLWLAPAPGGAITVTTLPETDASYIPLMLIASESAAAVASVLVVNRTGPNGMMFILPTFTASMDPLAPEMVMICEADISGVIAPEARDKVPSNVPVAAESAVAG